jgi:hypothetical protein
MDINCTVVIQAINFLITYIFLRNLLLKPVVQLITHKNMAKKIILLKLKEKEETVQKLIEKKNKELIDFRESVKKRYQAPHVIEPKIEADVLDKEDIMVTQELIQESKDLIIKGISDAL